MKNAVILLCVLVFSLACSSTRRADDNALLHLQAGTTYIKNNDFTSALRELLAANKLSPGHPVILNNIGIAYVGHGKLATAADYINQAIKAQPNYSDARNNLGRLYIEMGEYDKAIEQLQIVTQDLTYELQSQAWYNLGLAYFHKQSYETAEETFFKSITLNRKSCLAFNYYGRSLFEQKKFSQARRVFDQAVALCAPEKNAEPHYYGALSYFETGEVSQAKARLKEILVLYPNNAYATKSSDMLKIIK